MSILLKFKLFVEELKFYIDTLLEDDVECAGCDYCDPIVEDTHEYRFTYTGPRECEAPVG